MKSVQFGAFWKKTDRNGKEYLSGTINIFPHGPIAITLFLNEYKKQDNHPDFNAFYNPLEASKPSYSSDYNTPF